MYQKITNKQASIDFISAMEQKPFEKRASLKSQKSRRNKYCVVIMVCLFFFGALSAYAQDSKLRVAVIDIQPADYRLHGTIAKEVTGTLTTELVNSNKFRVAERSRIDQIMRELGLQSAQDASVRAAEIGKLLGVHKIITGECSYSIVSIRFIDVESGDIEKAVTIQRYVYNKRGKFQRELGSQEIAKKILDELFK
ncbi:MAG: CsgG/HfaB family protein [Prevotellaceae bacterium]|jgi:hypothetical protein|nr:CsgG/HfaB family protein [Prevotellaceae bacterium]